MIDIRDFAKSVVEQDADGMRMFFADGARIRWHNTNEQFTVDEYIRANCEYPGKWDGEIERIECRDDLIITVQRIFSMEDDLRFHVVSFMAVSNDKIVSIDEYWGEDGDAPEWRLSKHIGKPIKSNVVD